MRAPGQKLVKFCTLTHTLTHAAKLVVRIDLVTEKLLTFNIAGDSENLLLKKCIYMYVPVLGVFPYFGSMHQVFILHVLRSSLCMLPPLL